MEGKNLLKSLQRLGVNSCFIMKNWLMLSVHILSYGCMREVWRARSTFKSCSRHKLECSTNFPSASLT